MPQSFHMNTLGPHSHPFPEWVPLGSPRRAKTASQIRTFPEYWTLTFNHSHHVSIYSRYRYIYIYTIIYIRMYTHMHNVYVKFVPVPTSSLVTSLHDLLQTRGSPTILPSSFVCGNPLFTHLQQAEGPVITKKYSQQHII